MAAASLCVIQHTALSTADGSMQKQEWNMRSTNENTPNESYPVNHPQKALPGATQDTKQRVVLESPLEQDGHWTRCCQTQENTRE